MSFLTEISSVSSLPKSPEANPYGFNSKPQIFFLDFGSSNPRFSAGKRRRKLKILAWFSHSKPGCNLSWFFQDFGLILLGFWADLGAVFGLLGGWKFSAEIEEKMDGFC